MSQQAKPLQESQVTLPERFLVTPHDPGVTVMNCPSCDYSSTNKHYLRQHIDLVHTTERPFKCPFCDYAGKRSHSLKEHLIVHSDERPYQCTQCNAKFRKKGHLTNHYRMHSETQSAVVCSLCDSKAFASRDVLYSHLRDFHTDQRDKLVFCCNRCSYATTVEGNLHVHEMAHSDYRHVVLMKPKLPPSANIILKCSDCGFETNQRKFLERHVMEEHIDSRGFRLKTLDTQSQGTSPKYKCTECGYITADQKQLVSHALQHSNGKQPSDNCGTEKAVTGKKSEETQISRPLQSSGTYECSLCGYYCETQRTLKAHMWKHSGHKNLEYPTFQNGPLSMYDGTPLAVKNFINTNNNCDSKVSSTSTLQQLKVTERNSPVVIESSVSDTNRLKCNNEIQTPVIKRSKIVQSDSENGPSPKVIVQKLKQSEAMNIAVYDHNLSAVEYRLAYDGEYQGPASIISSYQMVKVTDSDEADTVTPDDHDGLKVMTDVCEAMERNMEEQQQRVQGMSAEESRINSDCYSATEKTAATLLSLLRQGPNINPACPPADYTYEIETLPAKQPPVAISVGLESDGVMVGDVAGEEVVESERGTAVMESEPGADSMSTDSGLTSDPSSLIKPKTGICSSLLAVIEQLRERQADDTSKGAAGKRRRKRKRNDDYEQEDSEVDVSPSDFLPTSDIEVPLPVTENLVYRCKLCHYRSSFHLMRQHMKMHKNKKPHECSLCDFVATGTSSLQDHMIQHCKTRQFQCKQCPAVFNYKSQLRAHTRVHEDGQAFYCDHCEYVTSYIDSFQDHLNLHSEVILTFTCIACREVFSDLQELQTHMKESCTEVKKLHKANPLLDSSATASQKSADQLTRTLRCDQCEFIALSVRSLKSHLKRHVNDKRYIQQPLEQYKCNMCGYVCHHMPSLKSHMWRHANETEFSYSFSDLLSEGTTPVDKEGKPLITLRCCQCGFETLEKRELDAHMKSHWDIIKKTFDVGTQVASG